MKRKNNLMDELEFKNSNDFVLAINLNSKQILFNLFPNNSYLDYFIEISNFENNLFVNNFLILFYEISSIYLIKINNKILKKISFIILYLKILMPLFLIKKNNLKNLDNYKFDNSQTYEIRKFSFISRYSNFKNNNDINSLNKNKLSSAYHKQIKFQNTIFSKLVQIFKFKESNIYYRYINLLNKLSDNSFIKAKIFNSTWKHYNNQVLAMFLCLMYDLLTENKNKTIIIDNLSLLLSHLFPLIFLKESNKIYFEALNENTKYNEYFFIKSNFAIRNNLKKEFDKVISEYKKNIEMIMEEHFHENHQRLFIKKILSE